MSFDIETSPGADKFTGKEVANWTWEIEKMDEPAFSIFKKFPIVPETPTPMLTKSPLMVVAVPGVQFKLSKAAVFAAVARAVEVEEILKAVPVVNELTLTVPTFPLVDVDCMLKGVEGPVVPMPTLPVEVTVKGTPEELLT